MSDKVYKQIQVICLSFPNTKETMTWGNPHFRVGEKIFCGYQDGSIGFKLEMSHAKKKVKDDPRFGVAPYVGHKGWVTMDVSGVKDWSEVKTLVQESYSLIAPKRLVAQIGLVSVTKKPVASKAATKAASAKPAAASKAASKPASSKKDTTGPAAKKQLAAKKRR